MLNPALGIIKIGVAANVESRRLTLECACGVPLTVLSVVTCGGRYEKQLHWAFRESRLLGEWFSSSPELLELASDPSRLAAFVEHKDPQMRAWQAERDAAEAKRNRAQLDALLARKARESVERANHPAAKARRQKRERTAARIGV